MPRRAFALIVALGMLALMSAVALTFVAMTTAELGASTAFTDQVRARMVAQAGMEWTVAELRRSLVKAPWSTPPEHKTGGAWDETMYFRDNTAGDDASASPLVAKVLGMGASLRLAQRPSYMNPAILNPTVAGGVVSGYQIDVVAPGYYLSPSHLGWNAGTQTIGDYFLLKVFDSTQKINLNTTASAQRKLMLNSLIQAVYDPELSNVLPLIGTAPYAGKFPAAQVTTAQMDLLSDDIDAYLTTAPNGRFNQKEELLQVPPVGAAHSGWNTATGEQTFNLIKDYISVVGYPDESVLAPNPGWPKKVDGAGTVLSFLYDGTATENSGLARQPLGRYPVNLNSAPPEVLFAVFNGIQGRYMAPGTDTTVGPFRGKYPALLADSAVSSGTRCTLISQNAAKALVKAIIDRRRTIGAFTCWRDFRKFLDDQRDLGGTPLSGVEGTLTRRADIVNMVWANCNPNAIINRFNADVSHQWDFEKASLTAAAAVPTATTELCLCGTGAFEIESLGRVMGGNGAVAGEYILSGTAQVFDVIRHTTQKDFFLKPAGSTGTITFTNMLTWPDPTAAEVTAGVGATELATANEFDGCLILQPASSGGTYTYLPQNANPLVGAMANPVPALNKRVVPLTNYPTPPPPNDVLTKWGDFTPDGMLCFRQRNRQIKYTSPVLQADEGTIELWVKLLTKPDEGSDEPLLYTVAPKALADPPGGAQSGVSWKLERFGQNLVSTRFWWVNPASSDPNDGPKQQSPYTNTYSEWTYDISGWQVGTWHHIVHRWTEGITQTEFSVDGSSPAPVPGNPFIVTTAETKIDLGTTTETIKGSPGPPPTPDTTINTHHWKYVSYTMGSNEVPPAGAAIICVGGYNYTQDPLLKNIKNTGTYEPKAGGVFRGMNGTIDDIGVYATSGAGVGSIFRYNAAPKGKFTHPGIPFPGRLAEARQAAGGQLQVLSAAMTFYPNSDVRAAGTAGSRLGLKIGGIFYDVYGNRWGGGNPAKGMQPYDDGGPIGSMAAPVMVGTDYVEYEVEVDPRASLYDTPVVDDITIYVGVPTRYLSLVNPQE